MMIEEAIWFLGNGEKRSQLGGYQECQYQGHNTTIKNGKIVRNTLKHWVNSPAGCVP
ncbi:hypothetical protein DPMN_054187 [Dreissena polymorpha]|uniref:Uncharacterized protein n=1 Tax=Dreissena polymorpha TaxID=45954 RepID=A0A9D4CMQ6_DREPO|nr:hypothetical protein DPMN_054187 [Dreissena polymorpha]